MLALLVSAASLASIEPPRSLAPSQAPARTELFAVRAKKMLLGDGSELDDAVLLVEGGRIRAAGRGVEVPDGTAVIEHDGTVTAGMIACHTYSGAWGEKSDPTRSVLADARIADAFSPAHSDFEKALRCGITSLVLAPSPENLAGGISAVVKAAGGRVLDEQAHLALALSAEALQFNRAPTSSAGALQELEQQFANGNTVFAQAASGRLPVMIDAQLRDEVLRAVELATRHRLQGTLVHAWLAGEVADEVARSGLGAIVGPFQPGTPQRLLQSVISLAEAHVPLGFALDAPIVNPESLRFGAAMCVRAGLDPATAWNALTSDGARLAGVGDHVGRLERGLDADFVLWSGDPLDLSSQVVAVFVDGVRVFGGKP